MSTVLQKVMATPTRPGALAAVRPANLKQQATLKTPLHDEGGRCLWRRAPDKLTCGR